MPGTKVEFENPEMLDKKRPTTNVKRQIQVKGNYIEKPQLHIQQNHLGSSSNIDGVKPVRDSNTRKEKSNRVILQMDIELDTNSVEIIPLDVKQSDRINGVIREANDQPFYCAILTDRNLDKYHDGEYYSTLFEGEAKGYYSVNHLVRGKRQYYLLLRNDAWKYIREISIYLKNKS